MIDAKYMESKGEGVPDRDIVNQMIIEMEYGKPKDNTYIGIVLFADKRKLKPVVIQNAKGSKKIHFLNMHPENKLLMDDAFVRIKNIVGIKV